MQLINNTAKVIKKRKAVQKKMSIALKNGTTN